MRNKFLLCLFAVLSYSVGGKAAINLTFDVTGKTASGVVLVYNTTILPVTLDEQGHGTCTIEHLKAVHAKLYYGMEDRAIFIEEGDKLHFTFNGADYKKTLKVTGGKEKIFRYLNAVQLTPLPESDYALPYADYVKKIEDKKAAALKMLQAWKLSAESNVFQAIEEGRIAYGYAQTVMMYPVAHRMVARDTAYVPDEAYYTDIQKMMAENERLLELHEYREYMKEGAYILQTRGKQRAGNAYERTLCEMNYLVDHLKNEKVREALLNVLAIEQIEQHGIKRIDEMMNLYNTYVQDETLRAAFQVIYDQKDLAVPGKLSPRFIASDLNGKIHTLDAYRGKYVYIDVWATWCGPCRQELPHLKKLVADYAGKNIVFVSLSVDANKEAWKKMAATMDGIQLYLGNNSDFAKAYDIDGIPRFILIDPEGKIVNYNMTRPSSPDTRRAFDALKGI